MRLIIEAGGASYGTGLAGGLTFTGGAATNAGGTAGALLFKGGSAIATTGVAGGLTFIGGTATNAGGTPGDLLFEGGSAIASTGTSAGGLCTFYGGSSNSGGAGGDVQLNAGTSVSGTGGSVSVSAGSGNPDSNNAYDGQTEFYTAEGVQALAIDQNGNLLIAWGGDKNGGIGNGGSGALVDQGYYYITTAGAITAPSFTSSLIVNAGAQAALTILFPGNNTGGGPPDGALFEISFVGAIAALTLQDNNGIAGNILGAPASAGANSGFSWRYIGTLGKWVRRY